MKSYILFITFILIAFNVEVVAQNNQQRYTWSSAASSGAKMIRGISDLEDLRYMWWNDVAKDTVDYTNLEVIYNLKYRRQSNSNESHLWMLTKLQIGTSRTKYYSIICQFIDDVQQVILGQVQKSTKMPGVGYSYPYTEEELAIKNNSGRDFVNSEIWINNHTRGLKERAHDYARYSQSIEYVESLPQFEWELMETVDTVAGYVCSKAKTSFRGREWTVWFTMEIPISAGPWKFNGLPGLILKAQDDKLDYIWECQNITQTRNPIVYYNVKKDVLTRNKWQRYMRQVHNSPLAMLGGGGTTVFLYNGKSIIDSDNWSIPYNPIELE